MKKFALATLLALAVSSASAVEVRLEGQDAEGKSGTSGQTVYELGIKQAINQNLAGDIVIKNYRTDGTHNLATRYEAGLTGSAALYGPVNGYVRGAVGEKFVSGDSGYSYYSVEPGISTSPVAGWTASLGYRFQDAFANGHNDQTRTWRSKVGYDLTKSDTVYLGYDVQRGDSDQNITKIGYIHRF